MPWRELTSKPKLKVFNICHLHLLKMKASEINVSITVDLKEFLGSKREPHNTIALLSFFPDNI